MNRSMICLLVALLTIPGIGCRPAVEVTEADQAEKERDGFITGGIDTAKRVDELVNRGEGAKADIIDLLNASSNGEREIGVLAQ